VNLTLYRSPTLAKKHPSTNMGNSEPSESAQTGKATQKLDENGEPVKKRSGAKEKGRKRT
jgi:hypothetical protein